MYKPFPENTGLPEIEKEILDFWSKNDVFEKSMTSKKEGKYFTFYEGPPTANGMPGIHHVMARAVKDLVCRYKTMWGYRVNRKAGWDTHGLPVEVEVEKTLGINSKNDIEEFGESEFNQACKDSIFKYLNQWGELTKRMGYWINLEDAFVTFHNEYIESVWWALKKFFDDGFIYKSFKIQPFCPKCESPLSSHEVAQAYQDLKEPSIYVKFQIISGKFKDCDFLVWTTTPWTLPSNVALCVNPDYPYVLISVKDDKLILAKDRLSVIKDDYTILDELSGKDLEFTEYKPLFDFYTPEEKAYYVTTGKFVTMDDGTGIVHIAPAYGEDDYNIGKAYHLPLIQAVGRDGKFVKETKKYFGKNFKEADPDLILDIKASGKLYKKEMYVHSYPHCWRHNVPLMYYATDSWFIRTTEYKDKMIQINNEINWHPSEYRMGRFGNWLEENKDWAISRDRFWGTPLPIWYYTDEDEKNHYECIGSIAELESRSDNFKEVYKNGIDLHKPFIDRVTVKSADGKVMKRVTEVIDCWFDSGSMPFAQYHYPFENKEIFQKNFPADFIAEGLDQTRGWFYSLHAISTFLFGKPAYKNLVVNGLILDKSGKKMSKRDGNVVDPFVIMSKYGADVLRWYLIASSPVGKSTLFNEDELRDMLNKFFDTLINTYKFFTIYANLSGFNYDSGEIIKTRERYEIDRWIISKFNSLKKDYFELMNDYELTRASRIISDFTINELSNWYIRRNRKRFRNPENDADRLSAYQTLYEVLKGLLQLIAPFSPFLTDKLYLNLTSDTESIHLSDFTEHNPADIDLGLEEEMETAQKIVYLIRSVRVKNNLKVRQPLKQILVPILNIRQKEAVLRVKEIILEEINVKELNIIEGDSHIIVKKAKPNFKSIGPKFGKDVKKIQSLINKFDKKQINEIELNGKLDIDGFEISSEDIEIFTENIEGWLVESDGKITVALDINLSPELIDEGILREFVNRIQNFRKTNDFKVTDKISISMKTTDKIKDVVERNFQFIKDEVSCVSIDTANGETNNYHLTEINGEPIEFYIEKI